jgi:hypothetical protein
VEFSGERRLARGRDVPPGGRLKVPELGLVVGPLLADRVGLLERRRAKHGRPHPRQNLLHPGLAAEVDVHVLLAHRHQVLDGRQVLQVVFPEEAELAPHLGAEPEPALAHLVQNGLGEGVHVGQGGREPVGPR